MKISSLSAVFSSLLIMASANAQMYSDVTVQAGFFGLNSSWGSAWSDIDNDGDLDVITIGHVQPGTGSVSQIWQNNGNETFTDITVQAGYLLNNGDAHGVVTADFDNDGDQDFYMVKGSTKTKVEHEHDLMMNNGDGSFVNVAAAGGVLGVGHRGRGGYAVDFDVDGDLDLFFAAFDRGTGDLGNMLFRNDGNNTWVDVAPAAGIARDNDKNRTASWADYNNDGYPDLLVMYPCALYQNQKDGTFIDVTATAGITSSIDCASSAWNDFDQDGDLDVYITSGGNGKTSPTTTGFMYRNNGDGTFTDVTISSNTVNGSDARGVVWGDVDNDGWSDLYIVNKSNVDANRLLLNNADGSFTDVTVGSGAEALVTAGAGVDATFVDYNNDGSLDLFIANGRASMVGEYILLKNTGNLNNWLKIDLVGVQSNRDGHMARVTVTTVSGAQMLENNGPSHYMTQDSSPLHFGLGADSSPVSISVLWPDGLVQTLTNVAVNQQLTITQKSDAPVFTDESVAAGLTGLNSSWGGSWSDFDNDGDLDVYTVGHAPVQAVNSRSQLWQNNGDGTFTDITLEKAISTELLDKHGAMWADLDNDGDSDLTIGKGVISGSAYDEVMENINGVIFANLPFAANLNLPSIGRGVYSADYDLDGDLDVLALGFMNKQGVGDKLFRNDGGMMFADITAGAGALVSGLKNRVAAWADYDSDGLPDVMVTPPCSLYRNQGDGSFSDVTISAGILVSDECQSPAWGDYDNDGDLDLYVTSGLVGAGQGQITSGFLYQNNGDGTFTDVTSSSGVSNPENARGVNWGDYDNDGFLDLYIVNGMNQNAANVLFRNLGNGRFVNMTSHAGVAAMVAGGGTDGAFTDYNNDGFLDLFVTNGYGVAVGPYVLLKNATNSNNWLKVGLEGRISNRDGIMSRLTLTTNQGVMFREYNGNTHYFSQDSVPVHFGLGRAPAVQTLELIWPSGRRQVIENIAANQMITVTEGKSIFRGRPRNRNRAGYTIWLTPNGWTVQWLGGENIRHAFSGTITTDGTITSAQPFNFESNDVVTLNANQIDFTAFSKLGHDSIHFTTSGATTVTFNMQQDGKSQPENIYLGEHGVRPAVVPLVIAP